MSLVKQNCLVNSRGENCLTELEHLTVDRRVRPDILTALHSEYYRSGRQKRLYQNQEGGSRWRPKHPNRKPRGRGNQSYTGCLIRTLRSVGTSCATSSTSPTRPSPVSGRGLP